MQAVILAGGLGTRLSSVVFDRPKPMALVDQKPFLAYLIERLKAQGIGEIILAIGHMHEAVEKYFKGCRGIQFAVESQPLGTGGAIKNAEKWIEEEDFLVINGDTYVEMDYFAMFQFHATLKSPLTLALTKQKNPMRFGSVEMSPEHKVLGFHEKSLLKGAQYMNAGVYMMKKGLLGRTSSNMKCSLEKEFIPNWLEKKGTIYGYVVEGYFTDIGVPEDYYRFKEAVEKGEIR